MIQCGFIPIINMLAAIFHFTCLKYLDFIVKTLIDLYLIHMHFPYSGHTTSIDMYACSHLEIYALSKRYKLIVSSFMASCTFTWVSLAKEMPQL